MRVEQAEIGLGERVALFGGLAIPIRRFGIILFDALAFGIDEAERHFGIGIAVRGERLQQAERFVEITVRIGGRAILQLVG